MVIAAACLLACMPGVSAAIIHQETSIGSFTGATSHQDNRIDQSTGDHAITVDQAKESIRVFMGDTSLEPEYLSEGDDVAGYYYLLGVIDNQSIFMVNADSGVVEGVQFWNNMPTSSPEIKIDRNTAYAKAVEYAGLKCDNFSNKTWALVVDKIAGPADGIRGYVFGFREETRTGNNPVLLPHIVLVSINPETGAIISYVAVNRVPVDGSEMTPEQKSFNDYLDHIDEHIISP